MKAELAEAGSIVTDAQIERWRRQGLLPRPRQTGLGHSRGSVVMVPPETAAQAMEIERLYRIRRKRDWVGWQLWMQGYEVDDRYWKTALEEARSSILDVRQIVKRIDRDANDRETDLDALKAIILKHAEGTPFHAPLSKLQPDILETMVGFGKEILLGRFEGFSHEGDAQSNRTEHEAVLAILGALTAISHTVFGKRIDFANLIEPILIDLSKALGAISPNRPMPEPSKAIRRELAQVIGIAVMLYRSMEWIFGRPAFGLRTINWIAANSSIKLPAAMLLFWTRYRAVSLNILPPDKIEALHAGATCLFELVERLRIQIHGNSSDSAAKAIAKLRNQIS